MNLYGFINFVFFGNIIGSIISFWCLISDLSKNRVNKDDVQTDLVYFIICTIIVLIFIFAFKWLKEKNIGKDENEDEYSTGI